MADFQQANVAGIEPLGNPALRDFIETLSKGYQAGAMPRNMQLQQQLSQQQQQELALKNALQERFGVQQKQSDIGLKNAQTQKAMREAEFGGVPSDSAAADILGLEFVKHKYGADSEPYKQALANQKRRNESKDVLNNQRSTYTNAVAWKSLPAVEKNRVIANAVGLGYDSAEAAKLLSEGKSLEDLATTKGRNLSEVEPNYPLSNQVISQMKNRGAFADEIGYLDQKINESLQGIGHKVFGYSPKQIIGAISNSDPDEQAKILAANALAPEMAALRLKAAGGTVGIEAIRELQQAALAHLNVFEPLVTPEVRQAMNKYISEWVTGASGVYNKSINKSAQLGKSGEKGDPLGLR